MSNFVFSRRAMQARINDIATNLNRQQLESLINRLNSADASRLHAMWELVFLHALSKAGHLQHENALPDGRCPDIDWTIEAGTGDQLNIIGDITTISDGGLEDQNPIKFLHAEVRRLASKFGLNPGSFWIDARGKTTGARRKSKMRLMLPEKSTMANFIKAEIEPWFQKVKTASEEKTTFERFENEIHMYIKYDPSWLNGGGSHTSYTVATSKSVNPLFNALKAKVKQLNGAPGDSLRLIIACDGGCDLLRHGVRGSSHYTYSASEVAEDFLRQNRKIDAVLLCTVDEQYHPMGISRAYKMSYQLVCNPPHSRSHRMTGESIDFLTAALNSALSRMPSPHRAAYHSANLLKTPGVGQDQLGKSSMQGDKITISSRGLLRLLAGEISTQEFNRAHGWDGQTQHANPFLRLLQSGLMISDLGVSTDIESDDDEVIITVNKFDAAAGPFIYSVKNTRGD